jgi:ATP-dependent Lon protease
MVATRSQKGKKCISKSSGKKSKEEPDTDSSDDSLGYETDDISEYESSDSEPEQTPVTKVNKPSVTRRNNIKVRLDNLQDIRVPPKTRSQNNKKRKRSQKKDDSDASDIDLGECSSTDEEYTKTTAYKDFVDDMVENMVEDSHEEIFRKKADLRSKRWKKDLSKREVKKYEKEYKTICNKISTMPTIQNILKIEMPFTTKCELMEKIIILHNLQPETFDHLGLKNGIIDEIEKYKKTNLNKKSYSEFTYIEKKLDNTEGNMDIPLKYKILGSDMSFENKTVVYRRYKYWITLTENSSEHPKLLNWINTVLQLPNNINTFPITINDKNSVITKFLYDIKYRLNRDVYGMESAKEQILCILNNKITNPNIIGSAIGLAGAQGCGKTKLMQVLSKTINIPFTSIPLGGATDSGHLLGHGFTYDGSRPGSIVDALIKMKSLSGIIFFDEIDKISTTSYGEEISKALLHITDFTQNHEFADKYLGNDIKMNLSNMWFIYSLNYTELIDKTLADRIPIIHIDGYNIKQKLEMSKRHLIPDAVKNVHLDIKDISFSDDALTYIITETNKMYTATTKDKNGNSGVRKLKDAISNVITKINFLKNTILEDGTYGDLNISFAIKDFKLPFVVERKHIDTLNTLTKKESSDLPINMYM